MTFSIGKYNDKVLCDVVATHARYLLLGRPWEFDKNASHSGRSNRYTFFVNGRKTVLTPLTSLQVYESQLKLKNQSEKRLKDLWIKAIESGKKLVQA